MKRNMMCLCVGLAALAAVSMTAQEGSAQSAVSLTVKPGSHWTTRMWAGPIPLKKTPQLAAWIETADGKYVTTITVTARTAKKEWRGNPEGGRPESLPVWSHAQAAGKESLDATTSATPKAGMSAEATLDSLIPGTEYRILLEVNTSFDYNETWPKDAKEGDPNFSGVNGQPSVVYEGRFAAGQEGTVRLLPVGMGSPTGETAAMTAGLEGLTTALQIIESAEARVR